MVKRMTETAKATGQTGAGLRSVIYGGGPMYQEDIIAAVNHFGPIFIQIYGQGECPMCITALSRADVADRNHPRWRARLASVGRPQAAVQVRIADEQGRSLPNGETGEIIVRGDAVMVLSIDDPIPPALLATIHSINGIQEAHPVTL